MQRRVYRYDMGYISFRKILAVAVMPALPILYLNIEVWAQQRGYDKILTGAEDAFMSSEIIDFFINPVWFAASIVVPSALIGALLNHFFSRSTQEQISQPYSKHPHHRFPAFDFDAFFLRNPEDPNRIWLHFSSPISSSLLKVGLDIKRQGQGEVGMLLSEVQAITKGQEKNILLCEKNESGEWYWASKQPSVMAQQAMKCYLTLLDDKDRRWHWGFAVHDRLDNAEALKIVGDDVYHMSQRKMI
jgi:hypothetical protein